MSELASLEGPPHDVSLSASYEGYELQLQISECSFRFNIAFGQTMGWFALDWNLDVNEDLLEKSRACLSLLRGLRDKQKILTKEAVDIELNFNRALDFASPEYEEFLAKMISLLMSICMLLKFHPPSLETAWQQISEPFDTLLTIFAFASELSDLLCDSYKNALNYGSESSALSNDLLCVTSEIAVTTRQILQSILNCRQSKRRFYDFLQNGGRQNARR